jgi:hypothetical protein
VSAHSLLRDPALESEHRGWVDYSERDAGHLLMPDGSIVSSADYAFLTAAAPYVLAAHLRALGIEAEVES